MLIFGDNCHAFYHDAYYAYSIVNMHIAGAIMEHGGRQHVAHEAQVGEA